MLHALKTWSQPFQDIWDGVKHHEIRKDDRKFQVGDQLDLREFEPHPACMGTGLVPSTSSGNWADLYEEREERAKMTACTCEKPWGTYLPRSIEAVVTYKTKGGEWGLPDNLCVLSFEVVSKLPIAALTGVATKRRGVPCYDKADQDEPLFVLRAQDETSPQVILEWIKLNIDTCPIEKLRMALETANAMSKYDSPNLIARRKRAT